MRGRESKARPRALHTTNPLRIFPLCELHSGECRLIIARRAKSIPISLGGGGELIVEDDIVGSCDLEIAVNVLAFDKVFDGRDVSGFESGDCGGVFGAVELAVAS